MLAGCGTTDESDDTPPSAEKSIYEPLSAPRLLRRLSLDIRGILPTTEELDAVEADPEQLESIREEFLNDPLLEERLVLLFNEHWLTRLDEFELRRFDYLLGPEEEYEFEQSAGQEPLRLMARIAVEDRPWTDIVTADTTMANEMLGRIWPIEYQECESTPDTGTRTAADNCDQGWVETHYEDDRPAAGVLSTNGLWWRYVTNESNMNRSRAASIARLLLCQEILGRPVSLDGAVSLDEEDSVAEAIKSNPACLACHSTVDPLAANLFGFWTTISYNTEELTNYHPEREQLGEQYLEVSPAFYGEPLYGLVDLGVAISNDSRFYRCTAETAAKLFWRRPIEMTDFDTVDALRQDLVTGELIYRNLLRAVFNTEQYQAGSLSEDATDEDLERENTQRIMPPDMIMQAIEELTGGYVWAYEGFEQLDNDDPGYRVVGGGVDGYEVTRAQQDPGITWLLTNKRHAQGAAHFVVQNELVDDQARHLFPTVTLEDQPGDAAFDQDLEALHWRLYGSRPDSDRLSRAATLWSTVHDEEGAQEAWNRLISAMLRDPEFLTY